MKVSIILAAGEGTRMKSKIPKVLHKVCGKPILEYVIDASIGAQVQKNVVIVGHGGDEVRDYFKGKGLIFENQPIGQGAPYGTGFAVMQDSNTWMMKYSGNSLWYSAYKKKP